MNPAIKKQLECFLDKFETYAEKILIIKDHFTAKLLPFIFNDPQRILHIIAEKQKSLKGYIRILFLKSRRFGGSTYVEGRFYWRTSMTPNKNTFIIAHEEKSTTTLYRMATLMHERNPIAPVTRKSNAQELIFDTQDGKGLKSEYQLATAKNVDAGRSQGIHYLHDSEEASWPDYADKVLDGIMQCVPDPPAESEIFRESTAKGYGNTFQVDCFDAYGEGKYPYYTARLKDVIKHMPKADIEFTFAYHNPKKDWVLVFIPWFAIDRYQKKFESEDKKKAFIEQIHQKVFDQESTAWVDTEEKLLMKQYGLSYEQLYWRNWAIGDKCRGNIDTFHQEYPSNIEEAFLSSGSNLYSPRLCDRIEQQCEKPIIIGDVVDRVGKSCIRANRHGNFSLWEKPDNKESYFITIDSGGGIKPHHEQDNTEPDPTCIDVYNHRTGAQAAQWQGHVDYDKIADITYLIGRMFFMAPACVELMNHGYTVVAQLKKIGYPMYEAKPGEPGFITSARRRGEMLDELMLMTRNGDIQIRAKETVSEMRTFVEINGKYQASSGCHDDRVITAAMASMMMGILPRKFKQMRDKTQRFTGFKNFEERRKQVDDGKYKEVYVS